MTKPVSQLSKDGTLRTKLTKDLVVALDQYFQQPQEQQDVVRQAGLAGQSLKIKQ